jgi:two-component sensor histidine kinase
LSGARPDRPYNRAVTRAASPSANARVSQALFALWALFWLLMVLIAVEDHRGDHGVEWWEPFLWEGSSCLVGTAWLLLQRRAAARWDEHLGNPLRWFGRHVAWLPLVLVTFVALIYAIRHGVYALTDEIYEHRPWPQLFFYESIKVLLFSGLWLGIIFGLASFSSWRRERERLLMLQKHLAESQLAQLKEQLRPHFLFNALNTISSLMQVDVERADRLLTMLADLLRATLQAEARQMTSLREELELLGLYASIMQERFAGRVTLSREVQEPALDAAIPTMLLQPLLENAYKHGVERNAAAVAITLTAARNGDRLIVTLRNSGVLREPVPAGIGLRNCRERLAALYGEAASLALTAEGGDVVARLALPYQRHAA